MKLALHFNNLKTNKQKFTKHTCLKKYIDIGWEGATVNKYLMEDQIIFHLTVKHLEYLELCSLMGEQKEMMTEWPA